MGCLGSLPCCRSRLWCRDRDQKHEVGVRLAVETRRASSIRSSRLDFRVQLSAHVSSLLSLVCVTLGLGSHHAHVGCVGQANHADLRQESVPFSLTAPPPS